MGGNGVTLKFTPLERSTVPAMHEGTVHEIEVNENTALNREDVNENVICIETLAKNVGENVPKAQKICCHLQEKLYV